MLRALTPESARRSINARTAQRERWLAMPNDLALSPVTAVPAVGVAPASRATSAETPVFQVTGAEQNMPLNRTVTLDVALGLVVVQFHDVSGASVSIPSQQLLQAYRQHEQQVPDPFALASGNTSLDYSGVGK